MFDSQTKTYCVLFVPFCSFLLENKACSLVKFYNKTWIDSAELFVERIWKLAETHQHSHTTPFSNLSFHLRSAPPSRPLLCNLATIGCCNLLTTDADIYCTNKYKQLERKYAFGGCVTVYRFLGTFLLHTDCMHWLLGAERTDPNNTMSCLLCSATYSRSQEVKTRVWKQMTTKLTLL